MTGDNGEPIVLTKEEAFVALRDMQGQSYQISERAHELLHPFADDASPGFLEEHRLGETRDETAFPAAIADEQRLTRDVGGIASTFAYQPIITAASISGILVAALGGEPSDAHMVGGGFTMDKRHDENIEWLEDALDLDTPE
jgi:hypothetical protein